MEDRKKGLVVVSQTNYDDIKVMAVECISALIRVHGYDPKMETKFLHDVMRDVELLSKGAREAYIRNRLTNTKVISGDGGKKSLGVITRYLGLGMHELAGRSEEGFRKALAPLVEKTVAFFSPPAKHPIIDGEFSCLLVIPPEWISLRRQFALLRTAYGLSPDFPDDFGEELTRALDTRTLAPGGHSAPKEPYVIIGINAGRALKGLRRVDADQEVKNLGLSYLLPHEYIQLLLVRPQFLVPEEGGLALGEKFSSGYLRVIARGGYLHEGGRPELSFVAETSNGSSFKGVGKPTYTKMVTL